MINIYVTLFMRFYILIWIRTYLLRKYLYKLVKIVMYLF